MTAEPTDDTAMTQTYDSFHPGQVWLDTKGERIQAHGGSIHYEDGVYYWYGENKERTVPGSGIWHWGMRAYSSTDLYNWEDRGLIVPPVLDDPESPLHPSKGADRPHILFNEKTSKYVCWIKVMDEEAKTQSSAVLTADAFLGPYEIVRTGLRPLGMDAGDFDLVVDPATKKAYYYFEKVHTELICAELTDDYTDVTGEHTSHFPHPGPPYTREAPAHFERNGSHYLITSGTTGYFPNFSETASAPGFHGPWTVLGDTHPTDASRTSFRSQITSVFRHPTIDDLYIALGDRWLPQLPEDMPNVYDSVAAMTAGGGEARAGDARETTPEDRERMGAVMAAGRGENTAIADYVWLPISFDGPYPVIQWHDEWRLDTKR
ncbi:MULTISPECIES: family 43 glycosylhydrolase [unclassified Rathayibacter]|uniref:family 43 glycosylhydrolase n=1 Tax=unclassified Rathayibacter TaxID=2609250 RepID=UPI0010DD82B3|nr:MULTISPECIES: family 43 glycosylhydrolase [unclassified Rathayibacter]TCL83112.1 glycosyl hydrolase family 43 [Rathayibacter sp. PhB192]TCM28610.1 glycosyl hydrolase family 43 [Rathayibacter sp. PhB179]